MSDEHRLRIMELVGALVAAFPAAEIGAETVKLYARMLADVPPEVLDAAVEQCIAECKFFPAVAELRDKALRLASAAGQHPTSAEAWGLVVEAIRRVGSYGRPRFADPLVARAVEVMDWRQMCACETPAADRAHFMRIYEQLVARDMEDARLLPAARTLRDATTGLAGRTGLPEAGEDEGRAS